MIEQEKFNRLEKYLFYVVIVINLIPVLANQFFPTMDGPAHLYNSNIINSLLLENNDLHHFFVFNQEPVPNWTGHFILAVLNSFLPSFIAEKILILFYLIALPLSFRALIKTINPKNVIFSYLIFPFLYSFLFLLGFYNFSLGLVLLFVSLNYWLKNEGSLTSAKKILLLFLLTTITYFTHVFVFALLMFFLGLHIFVNGMVAIFSRNSESIKDILKSALKKIGLLCLSSFIPISLFLYYFLSRGASGDSVFLEFSELIERLANIQSIIGYNALLESVYTQKIFYVLVAITIISLFSMVKRKVYPQNNPSDTPSSIKSPSGYWLLTVISVLLLYFSLPDSDGSAGYVSDRLGLLFFIFLIVWLSTQEFSKWIAIPGILIVLYCNIQLTLYYSSAIRNLNETAGECYEVSKHITKNSVVLPLNYSDNWLAPHFSNYLGADKPMIVLENYECNTGYFPIKWNQSMLPNLLFGTTASEHHSCLRWISNPNNKTKVIDYVFVLGDLDAKNDSCTISIKENLTQNYSMIFSTRNCQLFHYKR